jgi:dihydropyrimidine dehydrogenase (NAD+) subunit PreA
MSRLETTIAGVKFNNPVFLASATPSWDGERSNQAWRAGAGAVIPKSFGPPNQWANHPRSGRMKLIKCNNRNIGMVNTELYTTMPLQQWLDEELELAYAGGNNIIASVVAHPDPQETARNIRTIEQTGKVTMFEINVSCPMPLGSDRVGFQMGNDPDACFRQVQAAKAISSAPIGLKLTPTSFNMVPMAEAAERANADFLAIGNSVRSFAGVDIKTGRPYLPAYGGYSGPAIKPITMRHVSEVARKVKTPIIAVGGIQSWEDIVEYVMLGAVAVQVCTSIMWYGYDHFKKLTDGLESYLETEGLSSLEAVRGKALPYIKTIDEFAKEPPKFVRLDSETCLNIKNGSCMQCGKVCFYGAISFDPRIVVHPDKCDGCGLCMEICPSGSLSLVEEP